MANCTVYIHWPGDDVETFEDVNDETLHIKEGAIVFTDNEGHKLCTNIPFSIVWV